MAQLAFYIYYSPARLGTDAVVETLAYSIDIASLSKRFRRVTVHQSGYTTLKSSIVSGLFGAFRADKEKAQTRYTQAIDDITLRVPKGASLGVIGQNGSGKSTLLKLITGIYKPDAGRVSVSGRVAALIELGAGFHPDFSGRENVYLGGVMHGLSRQEVTSRFEEIVKFAELEAVIDDPVRTYSSGMFMRLGFSLAVHTDPDVLLVDEVLAVGDAAFVAKCKEKITQLRKSGKTLLLVTHDLSAVERWCDESVWLHAGKVRDRGDPRRVIDSYRGFVERGEEHDLREEQKKTDPDPREPSEVSHQETEPHRWGSREVEIKGIRVLDGKGEPRLLFHSEDGLRICIDYRVHDASVVKKGPLVFGVALQRSDGLMVFGTNTDLEKIKVPAPGNSGSVEIKLTRLGLLDGHYSVDAAVHRQDGYPYDYHKAAVTFAVRSPVQRVGVYVPQQEWRFNVE